MDTNDFLKFPVERCSELLERCNQTTKTAEQKLREMRTAINLGVYKNFTLLVAAAVLSLCKPDASAWLVAAVFIGIETIVLIATNRHVGR